MFTQNSELKKTWLYHSLPPTWACTHPPHTSTLPEPIKGKDCWEINRLGVSIDWAGSILTWILHVWVLAFYVLIH